MSRDVFRKAELERLAAKYARWVMIRRAYRPENIPELAENKEWAKALPDQRERTCRAIRDMARTLLIKAGYSRDIVYRNIT